MKNPLPLPGKNELAVATSANDLIKAYFDYKRTHDVEVTKREYIRAEKEVALAKIRMQRENVEQYLTGIFTERRETIGRWFDTLDKAIDAGNNDLIGMTMHQIIETIKISPLSGIQSIANQFEDPNVGVIEI